MFNINWASVAVSLIIYFLRFAGLIDWFKAAIKPSVDFWQQIQDYRIIVMFKLHHNGQVIYVEHLLNSLFNDDLPAYTEYIPTGIYIGPGSIDYNPSFIFKKDIEINSDPKYVFTKLETQTAPVIVLYTKEELENLTYDFTINVPSSLGSVGEHPIYNTYGQKIKAWSNLYVQAGKRFKILNYIP